jgi:alpha-glucosidase
MNPPYAINNWGQHLPLSHLTVPMNVRHYNNVIEYNVHSLYGTMETIATRAALEYYYKKRSLVISRSTYPGQGSQGAHWLGDNLSSLVLYLHCLLLFYIIIHSTFIGGWNGRCDDRWDDLQHSLAGIMAMNMFGIPLVGADICGFNGDTTEELCARWSAVGAFYPFARNHNTNGARPQEPYVWDSVAK